MVVVCKTKEELEKAQNNNEPQIIVEGELANHVRSGKSVRKVGYITLSLVAAALVAVPLTGGSSLVAVAGISATTGVSVALILAVFFLGTLYIIKTNLYIFLGTALLMAVWDQYDEIDFVYDKQHESYRLTLKRKSAAPVPPQTPVAQDKPAQADVTPAAEKPSTPATDTK